MADQSWYVLRVLTQHEQTTERELRSLGYEAMAPYREVWHRIRNGRPRKRRHALFPGYTFVCLPRADAGWQAVQAALNSEERRIAFGLLPSSENPAILLPKDVEYLASIADGKYRSGDDVPRLRIGDQVLIPEGPLKGFLGTILRIRRGKKATISVKQVKIASTVEIPLANLEKV